MSWRFAESVDETVHVGRFQGSKLIVDHFASSNPCPDDSLAEQRIVAYLFRAGPTWRADGDELQLDSGDHHLKLTKSRIPTATPARSG